MLLFAFYLTFVISALGARIPCPRANDVVSAYTNVGTAKGVVLPNDQVARFVVRYATASRWTNPTQATSWTVVNNDPTLLPPKCPQSNVDASAYSEDCLYVVLYVPKSALNTPGALPVYVWHHGGSFIEGSATNDGLDGSNLAIATNSIVAVIQYRLGVFGFVPPASAPNGASAGNLGVKDAITALKFIKNSISWLGGNPNKITIGGQSSGGQMVRALLASPSASSYFQGGSIHGDPVSYGFLKKSVFQLQQSDFYSSSNFPGGTSFSALTAMSTADILTVYESWDPAVDPSCGIGSPIRPNTDGATITTTLTTSYPSNKKPLMLTTNKNEGGTATGNIFGRDTPTSYLAYSVGLFMTNNRTDAILASPYYNPDSPELSGEDSLRRTVEKIITDYSWRCDNWDLARRWKTAGGAVWVGEVDLGITYVSNESNDYCPNRVCHEDEIYVIFGTYPSPTPVQATATTELQSRLRTFIATPSSGPNASGFAQWNAASNTNVNAIVLGGSNNGQAAAVDACDPSFWGSAVLFDWQIYGE